MIYYNGDEIVKMIHNGVDISNVLYEDSLIISMITPCMDGYESPYGHVEASNEFQTGDYPAWEGMNCTAKNGGDAWLTEVWEPDNPDIPDVGADELWFEWYLRDEDINNGMPLMYPTLLTIKPRTGMQSEWYDENNPYKLKIVGINSDMSEEVLISDWQDNTWNDGNVRTIDLSGLATTEKRGFKIYMLGTKNFLEYGSNLHTGWGWIKMEGSLVNIS